MIEFEKCLTKWKPILERYGNKYNERFAFLVARFLEWKSQRISISGINEDLLSYLIDINKNITLYAQRKEVKVYVNEYTGEIEYLVDDEFYDIKNIPISNESIKKIFGEEYYEFLISEKIL
jgi:hypothetical protein